MLGFESYLWHFSNLNLATVWLTHFDAGAEGEREGGDEEEAGGQGQEQGAQSGALGVG